MADRIQMRRDTLANWSAYNPILLEGEQGYVLDDPNLFKMGDGIHDWNHLPWRGYNGNILQEIDQNSENTVPSSKAVADYVGRYENNLEFVKLYVDKNNNVLWGIQLDGNIYYGAGVPNQIRYYINKIISGLNIDQIVSILNNLSNSLNKKVDKSEGKSLINEKYADSIFVDNDDEFLDAKVDSNNKIVESLRKDGLKEFFTPVYIHGFFETNGYKQSIADDPEWVYVITDRTDKVIFGLKSDGSTYIAKNIELELMNTNLNILRVFYNNLNTYIDPLYLPSYYLENSYLENKQKVISDYIRKAAINGDVFFFVTDTHWENNMKHSPAIIKEINKELNIHKLLHGGDIYHRGRGLDPYAVGCINSFRKAIGNDNAYATDGNHEFIYSSADWNDVFAESRLFLDDIILGGSHKNYYYFDNKQKKIRYINLASYGPVQEGGHYFEGFNDPEQITWLRDVALNTETGYSVILYTHYLYVWSDSQGVITWYDNTYFTDNIKPILEDYNANGNGHIVAFIAGHAHRDYINLSACSFPIIIVTCDNNHNYGYESQGNMYRDFDNLAIPRYTGTINEQAFDAVVFDKDSEILHFVRLGSGADNNLENSDNNSQVECRSVYYKTLNVGDTMALETYLTDSVTWEVNDTNLASIQGNVVTSLAAGSLRITATDSNNERHSIYIKILNS